MVRRTTLKKFRMSKLRNSLNILRSKTRRRKEENRERENETLDRVLTIASGTPSELQAMETLIRTGPATIVLVSSDTCPHCISFQPDWDELCKQTERKTNMICVKSHVYPNTSLSAKTPVSSVPTVLYVDSEGHVTEIENPRNKEIMKNTVATAQLPPKPQPEPQPEPQPQPQPEPQPTVDDMDMDTDTDTNSGYGSDDNDNDTDSSDEDGDEDSDEDRSPFDSPPDSGVLTVRDNPLNPIPASVITKTVDDPGNQTGGNPWSAFVLAAAQQAAPAAALLGAYSALPTIASRSSGLGAPRRSRRNSRKKSKQSK